MDGLEDPYPLSLIPEAPPSQESKRLEECRYAFSLDDQIIPGFDVYKTLMEELSHLDSAHPNAVDLVDGKLYARIVQHSRKRPLISTISQWKSYRENMERVRKYNYRHYRRRNRVWRKRIDQTDYACPRCQVPYKQNLINECQQCGLLSCVYCTGLKGDAHQCKDSLTTEEGNIVYTKGTWKSITLQDIENGNTVMVRELLKPEILEYIMEMIQEMDQEQTQDDARVMPKQAEETTNVI